MKRPKRAGLNVITYEMTIEFDVLGAFVEGNMDDCLVVTIKNSRLRMSDLKIKKKIPQPSDLTPSTVVLGLCKRKKKQLILSWRHETKD